MFYLLITIKAKKIVFILSNLTPLCRELLDENVGRVGGAVEGHDTPTAMEERVARAKRLMQQRQLEKERVEQEKEKEKELERRALGKNLLDFKQKLVEGWVLVGLGWVGLSGVWLGLVGFGWELTWDREGEG